MHPALIVLIVLCGVLLLAAAAWLFLVLPRPRKKDLAPFRRAYAHRGLWGGDVPENSLAAFRRAAERGFAVELDVQLSADGEVFVFHDYTLSRMCGAEGKLAEKTAAELKALRLGGTDEPIPTFREVLDVIGGRVPILVELKGESGDTAVCAAAAAVLENYTGAWCVESFNPLLLRWFKQNRPDVVRGLLVTDLIKEKRAGSKLVNRLLSAACLDFLCRPAFFAWDRKYPHSAARRVGFLLGAGSFVFTVHDETEYHVRLARDEYPIFDGFTPGT